LTKSHNFSLLDCSIINGGKKELEKVCNKFHKDEHIQQIFWLNINKLKWQ